MKPNIFWRCARRQPIRTLLLLLLMVGVVFAFTARAAEYLLLRQETERLGSYYKAVGGLSFLGGNTDTASFDEAREFLENDPRVAYTAWNEETSAILQGMYNADILGYSTENTLRTDYFFTGTLLGIVERRSGAGGMPIAFKENGDWGLRCYFRQEQVFSGAPELAWEGRIVKVEISAEDAPNVLQTLAVGEKYLIRGCPTLDTDYTDDVLFRKFTARDHRPLRPVVRYAIMETVEGGSVLTARPLVEGAPLFYAVPKSGEIDWSDPALTGVEKEVQICRDELSAMSVQTSSDMSTISRALGLYEIYLVDGRWLDHEDDAAQSRVCVIHEEMAEIRGLAIGDTITLKLRDVDSDHLYGGSIMYDLHKYVSNVGKLQPYETATETFQIVGTFNTVRPEPFGHTAFRNALYIPTSTLPEIFHSYHDNHLHATDLRFILTSHDVTEEFLADTQDALADMGLQASMRESGWDTFQQAVQPMLRSSLYNLVIFALVLLTALCLVAFLYLRARRKDMAIARALGVPAGTCVRQGALPLAVIGLIGTLGGAVAGWQYALGRGASTLAPLGALGEAATEAAAEAEAAAAAVTLPWYWLAAIFGGVFGLCLLLALGGMAYLSRKPVLELLTGGSAPARQKEQAAAQQAALDAASKAAGTGAAGATPAGVVTGAVSAGGGVAALSPRPAGRARGVAHTLRFVGCYIRRSAVKSTLVLLLAVLFTVGLAAIRIAILRSGAKIDGLYDSISVPVNLAPESSASYVMGGGFVPQKTINAVYDTGFVRDAYLEGQCAIMRLRREDVYLQDLNGTASQPGLREGDISQSASGGAAAWILSFDDLEEFMTVGSGAGAADADSADAEKIEITYQDGWDASMFAQDYADSDVLPVLLPAGLCEMLHMPADGRLALTVLWESQGMTNVSLVQVAGVYTGSLPLESDGSYLLAPSGVMDAVMDGHTAYSTARFALDPAYNRELDGVRATLDEILQEPDAGLFALRAVVQDEELKQAIEPLENSIQLMKTLFPVALALSLLAAAGVSALLILTEAREAAIMRVLGTTKLRTRIILSLQVIFMVLAGLMMGLTVSLTWAGSLGLAWATAGLSLLCATAYLLCATAGSAAGAVTVTNRPPLELLQVKE